MKNQIWSNLINKECDEALCKNGFSPFHDQNKMTITIIIIVLYCLILLL